MHELRDRIPQLTFTILLIVIIYGISNYDPSTEPIEARYYYTELQIQDLEITAIILEENFETHPLESLPNTLKHSGGPKDTAFIVFDPLNESSKVLYIHEEGEDQNNSLVIITDIQARYLGLSFDFMINGSQYDRHVFQLYNEDDQRCVGMNTRIGNPWRYRDPGTSGKGGGGWTSIPGFSSVEAGRWYRVEIFVDYGRQSVMFGVDGVYSDWLPSQRPWRNITGVGFRGNLNFPADGWYDNLQITEFR